ncbi:hypothetical protein BZA05DRAFT_441858 [Tricharina praecox]|uniref:uncharacterized protein n=1 Tax=Tricharina praecox TaxID=43433 RepID=UPI00221EEDC4|nr:uncharacterized protein BZA05DRAFT_441858 [Tricharina praecox]KAI5857227.1 hypothetical protein BZA05DRAFT_441858 [Tricharina praecox]
MAPLTMLLSLLLLLQLLTATATTTAAANATASVLLSPDHKTVYTYHAPHLYSRPLSPFNTSNFNDNTTLLPPPPTDAALHPILARNNESIYLIGGSQNLMGYAYPLSSPTSHWEPAGRWLRKSIKSIGGAAAAAALPDPAGGKLLLLGQEVIVLVDLIAAKVRAFEVPGLLNTTTGGGAAALTLLDTQKILAVSNTTTGVLDLSGMSYTSLGAGVPDVVAVVAADDGTIISLDAAGVAATADSKSLEFTPRAETHGQQWRITAATLLPGDVILAVGGSPAEVALYAVAQRRWVDSYPPPPPPEPVVASPKRRRRAWSAGAKAAVGCGVGVAAVAALVGAYVLVKRWRRRGVLGGVDAAETGADVEIPATPRVVPLRDAEVDVSADGVSSLDLDECGQGKTAEMGTVCTGLVRVVELDEDGRSVKVKADDEDDEDADVDSVGWETADEEMDGYGKVAKKCQSV